MIHQGKIFKKDSRYEELYYLSEFDRSMRSVYLENILKIENKLKTLIAYYFSEEYGYDNYLKIDNFETLRGTANSEDAIKKNNKYSISDIFNSKGNCRFNK